MRPELGLPRRSAAGPVGFANRRRPSDGASLDSARNYQRGSDAGASRRRRRNHRRRRCGLPSAALRFTVRLRPADLARVQFANRGLRFLVRAHLDEPETAPRPDHLIAHDSDVSTVPGFREELLSSFSPTSYGRFPTYSFRPITDSSVADATFPVSDCGSPVDVVLVSRLNFRRSESGGGSLRLRPGRVRGQIRVVRINTESATEIVGRTVPY
jgi:hypothetical protein